MGKISRGTARLLAAVVLLAGTAANAAVIVNEITGSQSPQANACISAIPLFFADDCSYNASSPTGIDTTEWVGPIFSSGHYAPGASPFSLEYIGKGPSPGDGKIAPPLTGIIVIDDKDTATPADDEISGTVVIGTVVKNFPYQGTLFGEETWSSLTHTLQRKMVDSATPNGNGGFDYVIGSAGFPRRLQEINTGSDLFPAEGVPTGTETGGAGIDGPSWDGPEGVTLPGPSGIGIATVEGNVGTTTTAFASDYSCVDEYGGPGYGGACDFSLNAPPLGPGLANVLMSISTDGDGNIVSASAYAVHQFNIFNLAVNPDSWDASLWQFSGTVCDDCEPPPEPAGGLFAVTGASNTPSTLYELSPDNGAVLRVVGPTGASGITSMDFHPLTGELYAIAIDDTCCSSTADLLILDTDTGASTLVARTNAFTDIGFHPDGRLFGNGRPDRFDDRIFQINTSTGAVTVIDDFGHPHRPGISFDSIGNGITKQGNSLYDFDPDIPATTFLRNVSGNSLLNTLDFSPADILFSVTTSSLVTINVNSGTQSIVGPVSNRYTALAFEIERCYVIEAVDDEFELINDGSAASFDVLRNDECKSDTPISIVQLAGDLAPDTGGTATTDGSVISYTPASGSTGPESFTYTAQDAGADGGDDAPAVDQSTATVTVNLIEDLAPEAVDDEAETLSGFSIFIDLLDNDTPGNAPSSFAITQDPANGFLFNQTPNGITYASNFGFIGADTFEYELTDANGDTDTATVTVGVFFNGGLVPIDIAPKDDGNNINLKSKGSRIEVAILSEGIYFDAPAVIDPLTLKFGPREANIIGSAQVRDVDRDGDDDLVVRFLVSQTGIPCGASEPSLSGRTFNGNFIFASGVVNAISCPRQ